MTNLLRVFSLIVLSLVPGSVKLWVMRCGATAGNLSVWACPRSVLSLGGLLSVSVQTGILYRLLVLPIML